MNGLEDFVQEFFAVYAYKPFYVYGGLVLFMYASAFGLPLPEEVVLISTAFLAYMALHPDVAPPPYPGAVGVNHHVLAIVAVVAVISSDAIIFTIGRKAGGRIFRMSFVKKYITDDRLAKIREWSHRYGYWTSGIFRFTPGLRFPGHLFCGMSGMPMWKFLAVDGTAALISIPPQIYLIAHYGDDILKYFKEFKIAVFSAIALGLLVYAGRKYYLSRWTKPSA